MFVKMKLSAVNRRMKSQVLPAICWCLDLLQTAMLVMRGVS